jgi:hypothetical protein
MVAQAARRVDGVGSTVPFHPLLFAAYPVLRLYAANVTEVEAVDIVVPLVVVVGLTLAGLGVLTLLLRDVRRAAIITSAVVLPVMLFGLVQNLAEPYVGTSRIPLIVGSVVGVAIAVVVALRARARLGSITLALNVIAFVLIAMTVVPVVRGLAMTDAASGGTRVAVAADVDSPGDLAATKPQTRDIYHLVFDRYGSEQALATEDIDNSEFIAWLRDLGFVVNDDARANYVRTTLSVGATLGMTLLDRIGDRLGPDSESYGPVVRLIENSRAGAFLQDQGYEYIHLGSWYDRTRDSAIADATYSPETEVSFASTLVDLTLIGEVTADAPGARPFERKHAESAEYQFRVLDELTKEPGPTYVFAHFLMPHTPFVFLEDGTFAPKRATHASQLAYTNARIKAFLEPLLALPEDERPIVILQADEGPYPARYAADEDHFDWTSATDEEVVEKYGILDALYLPGPEGQPAPDLKSPVNTYGELFRRYFGADAETLPDRSWTSPKAHPYDFHEITDRLDSLLDAEPAAEGEPAA